MNTPNKIVIPTMEDFGKIFVNLPRDLRIYVLNNVNPTRFAECCVLLKNGGRMRDFIEVLREMKKEKEKE